MGENYETTYKDLIDRTFADIFIGDWHFSSGGRPYCKRHLWSGIRRNAGRGAGGQRYLWNRQWRGLSCGWKRRCPERVQSEHFTIVWDCRPYQRQYWYGCLNFLGWYQNSDVDRKWNRTAPDPFYSASGSCPKGIESRGIVLFPQCRNPWHAVYRVLCTLLSGRNQRSGRYGFSWHAEGKCIHYHWPNSQADVDGNTDCFFSCRAFFDKTGQ